jgi:hypothetical protein
MIQNLHLRPNHPDFQDLPWDRPLLEWSGCCLRVVEVPRGLSRHPVVFVNYDGSLYALKELPAEVAQKEYAVLSQIEELRLPTVMPVGYLRLQTDLGEKSVVVTRYLDYAMPYRLLFMRSSLDRYRDHLLDAVAGLLVQLHLAGIYWGDCSLSNVLFRRDAGALQAYLVDAETAEAHPPRLLPTLRLHDLQIMEENINGDLADLDSLGLLPLAFRALDVGDSIRQRYQGLWDEITREQIISPDERYRIQERIRVLNALGFSVRDVEMQATANGEKIRLRVFVTDRSFHRDQLLSLTGLEAEEMQARQMMNEIQELKATLSAQNNRSMPLSVAAYHWLEDVYQPTIERLQPLIQQRTAIFEAPNQAELYCQVLEHKWYLSERAQHDVGHAVAVEDYLVNIAGIGPAI